MKVLEDVTFATPPTLLAAWPGMGNVGLITMAYLRHILDARRCAEIDMGPFFIPDSIVVKDGVAQLPRLPSSVFHYHRDPDLIIFESGAQVSGHDAIAVTKEILSLAQRFGVKRIITAAAFAQSMSYQDESAVLVACTAPKLLAEMADEGITPMPDGYIAGLNGLMLGVAGARAIESACFLGTIPLYATNLTYPKASLAIVRVLKRLFDMDFELTDLENDSHSMDRQLATIEERIRKIFPSMEEHDEEIKDLDHEKVPHHIMERIERLFQVVERDRSRAPELKAELDRWNLFELYENRFLDLFGGEEREE
jgi:uncharacterized protein